MELSKASATTVSSNLPLPLSDRFSSDDIAMILGTFLPRGAFVCECSSGRLVACNQHFLRLLGLDDKVVAESELSWPNFLRPKHPEIFQRQAESNFQDVHEWLEAEFLRMNREAVPVKVLLKTIRWQHEEYFVAFLEDISAEHQRESEWKRQLDEQKERALTAISSSLRVYHLSEKIKWTPVITRDLLSLDSKEELFCNAAKLLTDQGGPNYREVSFYLAEGECLKTAFSTREGKEAKVQISDKPRIQRFLETHDSIGDSEEGILLRLEIHDNFLGLCEILPYEQEKAFFNVLGGISELQRDFLSALADLLSLLIENIRLSREIKRQSVADPLTGVYNRRYFMEQLRIEMERATRYNRDVSLVFIDLDGFKLINDEHGHLQGDQVLRDISRILVEIFREADLVCRYGGDEFVVLLPEASAEMAVQAGEKLVQSVSSQHFVDLKDPDASFPVTVSVGVSTLEEQASEDEFLHAADVALFMAKRLGKNRVASYP